MSKPHQRMPCMIEIFEMFKDLFLKASRNISNYLFLHNLLMF